MTSDSSPNWGTALYNDLQQSRQEVQNLTLTIEKLDETLQQPRQDVHNLTLTVEKLDQTLQQLNLNIENLATVLKYLQQHSEVSSQEKQISRETSINDKNIDAIAQFSQKNFGYFDENNVVTNPNSSTISNKETLEFKPVHIASIQEELSEEEKKLVDDYNNNFNSIQYKLVEPTSDSIEKQRSGQLDYLKFEESTANGEYWLVNVESTTSNYTSTTYLLPRNNIKLNKYNSSTLETVFDLDKKNYDKSSDFKLKLCKPARVNFCSEGSEGAYWKVIKRGRLEYVYS